MEDLTMRGVVLLLTTAFTLAIFIKGVAISTATRTSAVARSNGLAVASSDNSSIGSKRILVRMLWVRHGLSCANVLDECSKDPAVTKKMSSSAANRKWRRTVEKVLAENDEDLRIDWEWGLKPRGWIDARGDVSPDCVLRLQGLPAVLLMNHSSVDKNKKSVMESCSENTRRQPGRLEGALGYDGDVIRLHDLYQDPALTTCSIYQSRVAGSEFRKFLRRQGWSLDLVASSTLLRAAQTAYHMFIEHGRENRDDALVTNLPHDNISESFHHTKIVQLPFINERAPAAMTAIQFDNTPGSAKQQRQRINRDVDVDSTFISKAKKQQWAEFISRVLKWNHITATSVKYPRDGHDWERFKAFLALELLPALAPELSTDSTQSNSSPSRLGFSPRKGIADAIFNAEATRLGVVDDDSSVRDDLSIVGYVYRQGPGMRQEDIAMLEESSGFDRTLTIAVVGHGAMIRKHCLREAVTAMEGKSASVEGRVESKVKANNNAVYEKLFVIERRTVQSNDTMTTGRGEIILREALGDCALIMDAPTREKSMEVIAKSDVESCSLPFDVTPFLNVKSVGTGSGEGGDERKSSSTECEATADTYNAFPILYNKKSRGRSAGEMAEDN